MIRRYGPEDAHALVELFHASVHQSARRDYSDEQIRAWAPDDIGVDRLVPRATSGTWVAELNGRVAGFATLESDDHVDMVYVHPDFQRRGVAKSLLTHLEVVARAHGAVRLYTEASITARSVFMSQGYQVLDEQTVLVRGVALRNGMWACERRFGGDLRNAERARRRPVWFEQKCLASARC